MSGDQSSKQYPRKQVNSFFPNRTSSSGPRRHEWNLGNPASSSSRSVSSSSSDQRPGGPQTEPRGVYPLRITKCARKYDERPPLPSASVRDIWSHTGHDGNSARKQLAKTARKSAPGSVPVSNWQSSSLSTTSHSSRSRQKNFPPARKSFYTDSPFYLRASSGGDTVNRRRTLMLPTPTNKPVVTKSPYSLVPTWQLEDSRLGESGSIERGAADGVPRMESVRRRQTIATTSAGWSAIPRGGYNLTSSKDRPRSYIGSDFSRRTEGGESSDDDMEITQPEAPPRLTLAETRIAKKSLRRVSTHSDSQSRDMESGLDSDGETSDESMLAPRKTLAKRSARKTQPRRDDSDEDSEERFGSEFEQGPETESTDHDEDDADVLPGGDSLAREQSRDANTPSSALLDAIKPFLPTLTRRHLPFLTRNLRVGFQTTCRRRGIMTAPILNEQVVLQAMYRGGADNFTITFDSWQCPLCRLLGHINTRQMLEKHLEWDHSGVEVIWLKVEEGQMVWRLILTFPERTTPDPEDEQFLSRFAYASIRPTPQVSESGHPTRISPALSFSTLQDEENGRPVPSSIGTTPLVSRDPTLFPARLKQSRSPSPTPLFSAPDTHRGRSTTVRGVSRLPPRKHDPRGVTPPPPEDPLGPAAQPPYLPATSEDGTITIHHTCRPGSPKLYDLLGTLPMDKFGVLSWAVLDREAEIFESDDIRDEHKVMHALWARWIFLNRKLFIADFFLGTMEFVNEYWKMIHRAAGWSALRYWLLMLLANRYLTGSGVAQVLKHYEKLTKMDSWYE